MKRNYLLVTFAICFVFSSAAQSILSGNSPKPFDKQIKALTKQMVKSLGGENKNTIAIMEFPDVSGKVTELGRLVPEELTTQLFKTGQFQVVERQLLNKVLEEQKVGLSGIIDASTANEIGRVLGVGAIVTGTVSDRGTDIRINARIISTETANVFAVASASVLRENHLVKMLGKEIEKPSSIGSDSGTSNNNTNTSGKALKKAMIGEMKLELMSVQASSSNKVIVAVSFTNKSKHDKEYEVISGWGQVTKMYDNMGQEYICKKVTIGSKSSGGYIKHLFISGIPTKAEFVFENIDPDATSISLLRIGLDDKETYTEFRKIEIQK